MVKVAYFCIKLDKEMSGQVNVYHPGEQMTGRCILEIRENGLQLKGFDIKLKGEVYAHWTERKTRTVHRDGKSETEHYTESYTAKDKFLKNCIDMRNFGKLYNAFVSI